MQFERATVLPSATRMEVKSACVNKCDSDVEIRELLYAFSIGYRLRGSECVVDAPRACVGSHISALTSIQKDVYKHISHKIINFIFEQQRTIMKLFMLFCLTNVIK